MRLVLLERKFLIIDDSMLKPGVLNKFSCGGSGFWILLQHPAGEFLWKVSFLPRKGMVLNAQSWNLQMGSNEGTRNHLWALDNYSVMMLIGHLPCDVNGLLRIKGSQLSRNGGGGFPSSLIIWATWSSLECCEPAWHRPSKRGVSASSSHNY